MKAHIIENNKVVNTIEVESLDFMPNLIDGSVGGIGWEYINGELIEPTPTIEVPQMLTPRQARLALIAVGLLDEVDTLLAGNKAMQIWWEYSLDIQRNHEHIVTMGGALGLAETQLDDLFIEGAKL